MLVGFGQVICRPVGPRCDECSLASASPSLCPSAKKGSPRKEKLKKEQSPKIEIEIEGEIEPSSTEVVKVEAKMGIKEEGDSVVVMEEHVLTKVKSEVASPVKGSLGW